MNTPYCSSEGPLHLLIDSGPVSATGSSEPANGIKVEGGGEGNARKHGASMRRVRRKVHPGIDEQTPEVRAVDRTGSDMGDAPVLPELPELPDKIDPDQDIPSAGSPPHSALTLGEVVLGGGPARLQTDVALMPGQLLAEGLATTARPVREAVTQGRGAGSHSMAGLPRARV